MDLLCTSAIKTKPVQTCINLLTIGTISALSTNVFVRFKNVATGRNTVYTSTSSGGGLVVVSLSGIELLEQSSYQITINSLSQSYDITISGQTAHRVLMPVERVQDVISSDVTLEAE